MGFPNVLIVQLDPIKAHELFQNIKKNILNSGFNLDLSAIKKMNSRL